MDVEDHPAYNLPEATEHYAGDVVPIRPANSPANNAGKQNQKQNEKSPGPKFDDPKITRIYG